MAVITSSGFHAEVDTNALNRLLSISQVDRKREKEIKNLISRALSNARKQLSEAARSQMDSDKRQAWRAVKYSIYKQILGGNVSIFSRRRAGSKASVPPSSRGRSADTERYESYLGADRSFILRILNAGNSRRERIAQHMDGHTIRRGNVSMRPGGKRAYVSNIIGYRGVWKSAGGFFEASAPGVLDKAAQELSELICQELVKEINKY